jgi:hypothetical protein
MGGRRNQDFAASKLSGEVGHFKHDMVGYEIVSSAPRLPNAVLKSATFEGQNGLLSSDGKTEAIVTNDFAHKTGKTGSPGCRIPLSAPARTWQDLET